MSTKPPAAKRQKTAQTAPAILELHAAVSKLATTKFCQRPYPNNVFYLLMAFHEIVKLAEGTGISDNELAVLISAYVHQHTKIPRDPTPILLLENLFFYTCGPKEKMRLDKLEMRIAQLAFAHNNKVHQTVDRLHDSVENPAVYHLVHATTQVGDKLYVPGIARVVFRKDGTTDADTLRAFMQNGFCDAVQISNAVMKDQLRNVNKKNLQAPIGTVVGYSQNIRFWDSHPEMCDVDRWATHVRIRSGQCYDPWTIGIVESDTESESDDDDDDNDDDDDDNDNDKWGVNLDVLGLERFAPGLQPGRWIHGCMHRDWKVLQGSGIAQDFGIFMNEECCLTLLARVHSAMPVAHLMSRGEDGSKLYGALPVDEKNLPVDAAVILALVQKTLGNEAVKRCLPQGEMQRVLDEIHTSAAPCLRMYLPAFEVSDVFADSRRLPRVDQERISFAWNNIPNYNTMMLQDD